MISWKMIINQKKLYEKLREHNWVLQKNSQIMEHLKKQLSNLELDR